MKDAAKRELIPDVLADRYASPEMVAIWGATQKNIFERQLWLAVLRAQAELGVSVPEGAVEAYERELYNVDLESIRRRELENKHDVNAKIEEYNALAGFQEIHKGMTSRDLTDNIEQMQMKKSLELIRDKTVAVLARLAERAAEYQFLALSARSHNVAAQPTTYGKRIATGGEELLLAFRHLVHFIDGYPLRGIKGPVGTSQDQLDLLGSMRAVHSLEKRIGKELGFKRILNSVGQIYPRSLDYEAVTCLAQLAAGPSSFLTTLRLMAGYELATEGFAKEQKGSSAMPHKMNARTSERINGFNDVLQGFADMVGRLSGHQWQEGDVSCSVVRRVALPGACFAMDGLLEAFLTILDPDMMAAYPATIERELNRYLPFLATTKVLMASVKKGTGRETAYLAIREHAKDVALRIRKEGIDENDLYQLLGADERIPLTEEEIRSLVGEPIDFTGDADGQVIRFCSSVALLVKSYPEAAEYKPSPIL